MATGNAQKKKLDNICSYLGTCGATMIRELLSGERREVRTIKPAASVFEALETMSRFEIGALVVVEGDRVTGVISERDYARKVILIGKSSRETSVREIMSSPARTVSPEQTVAECLALMTDRHFRHLPVLKEGELIGIVSMGDLVKSVISDQEQRIEQFEKYIRGAYPS